MTQSRLLLQKEVPREMLNAHWSVVLVPYQYVSLFSKKFELSLSEFGIMEFEHQSSRIELQIAKIQFVHVQINLKQPINFSMHVNNTFLTGICLSTQLIGFHSLKHTVTKNY